MVLADVRYIKSYDSIWDFTEKNLKKVKEVFKDELRDLKKQTARNIANHLIEKGICDEEVINEVLEKDKKKYFVEYIEEGNGYFKIFEVK